MRLFARVLLVLLILGTSLRAVANSGTAGGELIDHVWAGHPVGFALLIERGHQFLAYYDAERRLTVAGRKLGTAAWSRVRPPGVPVVARKRPSNEVRWDSHNYLRLALDRDGYLHVSGNMHVDPLVYYRTAKPFDVTTLERHDRMTGERETRCTYPVFFKNAGGDLLFRYRDGSSGNGADLYNIYDPGTRTWRRQLETPLLDGEGERNAYASEPRLGPDGRFHLLWMWRETPDCATNHTLSYARSRDFKQWENSRGQRLALPITLGRGEVVDAAKPGEGLINMTFNLGFDTEHQPVIVYHRYDAQRRSQAYVARPAADGGWAVRALSDWNFRWDFSGGGSIPAEVRLGVPRVEAGGELVVDYTTVAAGSGQWRLRAGTWQRVAQRSAAPAASPGGGAQTPGMEVQRITNRANGRRYVLRWETLPRNRDRPREVAPPPSELRLYELPDDGAVEPERIGS